MSLSVAKIEADFNTTSAKELRGLLGANASELKLVPNVHSQKAIRHIESCTVMHFLVTEAANVDDVMSFAHEVFKWSVDDTLSFLMMNLGCEFLAVN
jgi:hypothetical protein